MSDFVHGYSSYIYHKCRCVVCTTANTMHQQGASKRRAERPLEEIPHGRNGYTNYKCRCEICKEGNSSYLKNYRRKKK